MDAYKVKLDRAACTACGEGTLWTVVGPDGVAIGQSFADEVDAEETAGMLNAAYELGYNKAHRKIDAALAPSEGA